MALFVPLAMAQSGSLEGTVTDSETGEIVPGANVLLTEISRGAATDAEGDYSITGIPAGTYTLRITYVGYQAYSQQVTISANETLERNVQLQPSAVGLDEVVVTGYGSQQKREVTGSISSVSSEDFENVPVQNTEAILQGRAAGVQVTSTSGNPGGGFEVNVRGVGSINAGTDPLYIVDGVQISSQNQSETTDQSPLNSINPSDIESIEVLKDAAASAIYGAQAANGVVLITTKRGAEGDTQIRASYEYGSRYNEASYSLLNGPQWTDYFGDAFGVPDTDAARIGFAQSYGLDLSGISDRSQIPTYDWEEFIFQRGISRKGNVSLSGGDETTRFYISASFEDTEGSIESNDYGSYTLRTNFDHDVSDKLTTSLNLNLSNQQQSGIIQDGPIISAPVSAATFMPPVYTPFLPNGEYNPNSPFGPSTNPALVLDERVRQNSTTSVLGNLDVTYDFTEWLSLSSKVGVDYRNVRDNRFEPPVIAPGDNGFGSEGVASTTNFNANLVLNFNQTFDEVHSISGLLGTEYRRDYTREVQANGIGYSTGNLLSTLNAAATPDFIQGFYDEFRIASYFGQAKYNYDDRYQVNTTLRYDGSSRFGVDNRWGFFPSASVAWTLTEEDFFNVEAINDLKLRVSYGITGNSDIGNFASRGTYGTSGSYLGTGALAPSRLENNVLTWEEAKEINVGLDYSLLDNRINGSINVYQRDNENLLLNRPLPLDSGYGSITQNVGQVRNQGLEIDFESVNISTNDFVWSTRFNFSVSKNEVLELNEGQEQLGSGSQPIAVGHSINAWNVPNWAGVNPADGRPMWYDANGEITYQPLNADRKWNDGGEQDVLAGLGTNLQYKGLTLDVFFQGSYGQTAFPAQFWYFLQTPSFGTNASTSVLRRWQEPGQVTDIPRQVVGDSPGGTANWRTTLSSQAIFDASYIRLKTVRLGYNLPSSLTDKVGLRNVRLYVVGNNLYTWTSWPSLDPEVAGSSTQASYPNAVQINGGIEVQF
jgi:TonB-linked SusC/RagA family outer membrane protein